MLVNGPPASGKTTVGRQLAEQLSWPFLSRDTVKEVLFDALGVPDREANRRLGHASQAIVWALLADFPDAVDAVVEAWFGQPPHDADIAGLAHARVGRFVEVWCQAPAEVLVARYAARVGERHPGHPDLGYVPELLDLAGRAQPMALGPVRRVDTSGIATVDFEAIRAWVWTELAA